jgi:hypothetical protein
MQSVIMVIQKRGYTIGEETNITQNIGMIKVHQIIIQ